MSTTKIYGQARRKQRQTEASVRNGDRRPAKKAGQSESQCLRELQDAVATLKVATDSLAVELRLPGKCFAETAVWEGRKRLASALGESSKLGGREAVLLWAKGNRLFTRSLRLAEISRSRRRAYAIRKAAQANGSSSCVSATIPAPVTSGHWEFSSEDEPRRRLDPNCVAWDDELYDLAHGEW